MFSRISYISVVFTLFLSLPAQAGLIGFADVVVEFFNNKNGSTTTCTDSSVAASNPTCSALGITLGDEASAPGFFAITARSFITLGFLDEFIFDGPGNDIFIREIGNGREFADIFVSSTLSTDPNDFTLLGRANGNTVSSFDLASIGFTEQVRAVKVLSFSNGGSAPGFDLANIEALQFTPSEIPTEIPEPSMMLLTSLLILGLLSRHRFKNLKIA